MKKITTLLATLLCILGLGLSPAHAATKQCKELSKTACSSSNSCSWVKGYTRKDGVKVSSFCRKKAKSTKKKAKDTVSKKKKSTKKKATKKKSSTQSSTKKKKTKAKTEEELKKLKAKETKK